MNEQLRRAGALVFVDDLENPSCDGEDAHHLLGVLRLRPGEAVAAADGQGAWRPCRLGPAASARARERSSGPLLLEPTGDVHHEEAPRPALLVGFALQKGDRPEWTVQKLTELGIDHILPLICERTVVRLDEAGLRRRGDRLRRVAREASSQCRRARLPQVADPMPFVDALVGVTAEHQLALAEPGGEPLAGHLTAVFVGPEGGFAPAELAHAPELTDLGPLVLRGETAALLAGALLSARWRVSRSGGVTG